MFVQRNLFPPRRMASAVAGVCFLLIGPGALRALAAPPHYADTLPLSKVRPGMVGYGLTTFKGTTISRFKVTVVGVIRQENMGHDLILVRMSGGPLTERHANLVEGMSGSPIYLNGKVAGAFSMGEKFPREPLGMVTPIEDMLEAWDPGIPQQPNYYLPAHRLSDASSPGRTGSLLRPAEREQSVVLPHPIEVGGRRIARLVLNARPDTRLRSTDETAVMHPCTQMLAVSGLRPADRDWLQKEMDQRGYAITVMAAPGAGAGGISAFAGAPLRPGSAFGTWLATGDVQVGGTGTITYRKGDRVLAFGHPLLGLGALNAAISSAYILDVFPGYEVSHHIAVPGPIIGTLRQDRNFSISGEIGPMPTLVPFTVAVRDHTTGRAETFHVRMFQHPDMTPLILRLAARELIGRVHSFPGDVMANVTTMVDAAEIGKVTRTNLIFNNADIASAATSDLDAINEVVSGNPFYPLPIRDAQISIDIVSGHDTATIERIFLQQGKYAPGDTMSVGVQLKPYRRPSFIRTLSIKIPSDTPSGRYPLTVRGGAPTVTRLGPFTISSAAPDTHVPPVNVRQMVARLSERELNTDMTARLALNSIAPAIEGEKLSQLPPNVAILMRSDRDSGVRLERDELRAVASTPYVVSGTQQLLVTVQRKDSQEPAGRGSLDGSSEPTRPSGGSSLQSMRGGLDNTGSDDAQIDPPLAGEPSDSEDVRAPSLTPLMRRWMDAASDTPPAVTKPVASRKGGRTTKAPASDSKSLATDRGDSKAEESSAPPATDSATTSGHSDDDKPVGRPLRTWRQAARSDFAAGKFDGSSVTAAGELRLAPRLTNPIAADQSFVWSLVADAQGNLYAGTGMGGKILKVDLQGKMSVFATLPQASIQSLLLARDGSLWAGSGVQGSLYHVRPDGTFLQVATLPEKYLVALVEDSRGNLYIGPGGGGTVYRLNAEGAARGSEKPVPFFKSNADHIMALALDAHDNLYVGSGNDGILYKVTPDGKSSVLYDARENSITALTVDAKGNVYAGTGPRGMLYRIAPDGQASVVFDHASSFYTSLCTATDGTLYAATVNAVYRISPAPPSASAAIVQPLDSTSEVDFLALAALPDGNVAVGTGNVGCIYRSGALKTGSYQSPVHDARLISRWGTLRLDAVLNPASTTTDIRVETRSGGVSEPDASWSDWAPVRRVAGNALEGAIASPPARFIQYRLTLTDSGATAHTVPPAVSAVTLSYLPHNQAPHIAFQSPVGGERWSRTQTVRWSADDPDSDTLAYDLYISSDGVNWKPLDAGVNTKSTTDAADKAALDEARKKLESQKDVPDSIRRIVMQAASERAGGAVSLRQTSKRWDTTGMQDGVYWLKAVASDRISNPIDSQTAEAISEPFVICNTAPALAMTSPQTSARRTVSLQGSVEQATVEVSAVQYRIDGGEWIAAAANDGLFDSPKEAFSIETLPLTQGKHKIEVAAFNTAGNKTTQTVEVTIP